MGADGAALATTLVRWFMCMTIVGYILTEVDRERYGMSGCACNSLGRAADFAAWATLWA
jgi:hypothetical protein